MSAYQRQLILEAYNIIGETTPLTGDCGELCGGACCVGDGGMMLLPGESDLLSQVPGFYLYRVDYQGSRGWWMTCDDTCDRSLRPFQCRIFPLGPAVGMGGALMAAPDPRAGAICPLAGCEGLAPAFWEKVNKALAHLSQEPELYDFLCLMAEEMTP